MCLAEWWIDQRIMAKLAGPLAKDKHTGSFHHVGYGLVPPDGDDRAHSPRPA
jgi:hypothetical protein